MKRVVFFLFLSISLIAKAQIPNNSFEDWNVVGSDTILGSNWIGKTVSLPEKIFIFGSQGTVSRVAADGNNFVSLAHTDTGGSTIQLGYLYSKFAYKGRPKSFVFSGMYLPQTQGERFAIVVTLTTANNDTISSTLAGFPSTSITNWTNIGFNLNYTTNPNVADSCYIRFIMLPNTSREASLSTRFFIDNVRLNEAFVSVSETFTNNNTPTNINVYPNPASNKVKILFKLQSASQANIIVSNTIGQQLITKNIPANKGDNSLTLNTSSLKNGMYIYTIKTNTGIKTGKLIISK